MNELCSYFFIKTERHCTVFVMLFLTKEMNIVVK